MEKAESDGAASRRSTRLAIAIPIAFSGKDAAGNAFKENTRTIVVNKHGAKIVWPLRSALAGQTASRMGLKPVAHMAGGFGAWKREGGPVEMPDPAKAKPR